MTASDKLILGKAMLAMESQPTPKQTFGERCMSIVRDRLVGYSAAIGHVIVLPTDFVESNAELIDQIFEQEILSGSVVIPENLGQRGEHHDRPISPKAPAAQNPEQEKDLSGGVESRHASLGLSESRKAHDLTQAWETGSGSSAPPAQNPEQERKGGDAQCTQSHESTLMTTVPVADDAGSSAAPESPNPSGSGHVAKEWILDMTDWEQQNNCCHVKVNDGTIPELHYNTARLLVSLHNHSLAQLNDRISELERYQEIIKEQFCGTVKGPALHDMALNAARELDQLRADIERLKVQKSS